MEIDSIQIVATVDDDDISMFNLLRGLHLRGQLLDLIREAVVERLIARHAQQLGLSVTDQELQNAADRYRVRTGLNLAESTHAWLGHQRLSVDDFEANLERELLAEKLKEKLTQGRIAEYFEAHAADFASAQLWQIVVPREDIAHELLLQLQDEGVRFVDLARRHSLVGHESGGFLGKVTRRHLSIHFAEAIFSARAGDLVGPLADATGFHLFRVESISPGQLDVETKVTIRDRLFEVWLAETLKATALNLPLLDALRCRTN